LKEIKNFVGGEWRASQETWEKTSPFDGRVVARVHEAGQDLVDVAVQAGQRAVAGEWGAMPIPKRVAIIRDMAQKLVERVDDLIDAAMADTGRPYWQASNFDGRRATNLFDGYCDLALSL